MRRIEVANLTTGASIIGMGCASLGSRIGRREGLRALERAFEAGITWFDAAPSYGDSEAESILGEFAGTRRDHVEICTKVGVRPARTPLPMRAAKPMLRYAVDMVPMLRRYVSKARPSAANLPLTTELISSSVDASLKRLGTDHVEVLALHAASSDEVVRDDILAALERILRSGKTKAISIASSLDSGLLGVANSGVYGIIQVANNPFQPSLALAAERLPVDRTVTFVTHSVYGAFGALRRLSEIIESNAAKLQLLRDEGYRGNTGDVAAAFLADYALATNCDGITLFSMLRKEHLDFNLGRLKQLPTQARVKYLAQELAGPKQL
jgi:aryl-alcohol dehydrogenase-like predicted oxidoreductase